MKAASRTALSLPSRITASGLVVHLVLLLLSAGSLAVAWWSYQRLLPLQKQSNDLSALVSRLTADIAQMESKWSEQDIERVLTRFTEAEARLFGGQEALLAWFGTLRQRTVPLALDANAELGKASPQPGPGKPLAIIPATISIDVRPAVGVEAIQSPYQRVLQLCQFLYSQEKRADLVELTVLGGSNSVSRAVAVLDLWAGEETP